MGHEGGGQHGHQDQRLGVHRAATGEHGLGIAGEPGEETPSLGVAGECRKTGGIGGGAGDSFVACLRSITTHHNRYTRRDRGCGRGQPTTGAEQQK